MPDAAARPKNVLLIVVDQWRADCLSYLGHPCLRTPNLDALCADGVTFRNHFTQAVPCGPGRAFAPHRAPHDEPPGRAELGPDGCAPHQPRDRDATREP